MPQIYPKKSLICSSKLKWVSIYINFIQIHAIAAYNDNCENENGSIRDIDVP